MPIFTLGYTGLGFERFAAIVEALDAVPIDVRSSPRSRNRAYNRSALERTLDRYEYAGNQLGGFKPIDDVALVALQALAAKLGRVVIFCACKAPGDCHRHHAIAKPLLVDHDVDIEHVFPDGDRIEIIRASMLEQVLRGQREEYDCVVFESLEPLRNLKS